MTDLNKREEQLHKDLDRDFFFQNLISELRDEIHKTALEIADLTKGQESEYPYDNFWRSSFKLRHRINTLSETLGKIQVLYNINRWGGDNDLLDGNVGSMREGIMRPP